MKHFHHIFQVRPGDMGGGWRFLLADQFALFEESGLVEQTGCVNIGVIGTTQDRMELRRRLGEFYPYAKIVNEINHDPDDDHNDDWYEGATLLPLWQYCVERHSDPNATREVVLYTHGKSTVTVNKHTHAHRKLMEYFCVEQWATAKAAIESGFDVAGAEWRHAGGWHFSGNFWLAGSDYIAGLMNPMTDCRGFHAGFYHAGPEGGDNSRIKFEMWVGSGNPKVCQLFSSGGYNWYYQSLTRRQYVKGGG